MTRLAAHAAHLAHPRALSRAPHPAAPHPAAPHRAAPHPIDDGGAGAVLTLAIVACVVVFGLSGVALAGAMTARQRVIGASDLAALAGADAASGAVPGDPCDIASSVATGGEARLARCRVDGLVVEVTVVGTFAGIPISARSRAGPAA